MIGSPSRAARLLGRDRGKVSQDGKPHRPGVKGHRSPKKAEPVAPNNANCCRRLKRDSLKKNASEAEADVTQLVLEES
ncbi:hypothetical protein NQZ68_038665 [Dissostichus eleginoides]|nr:hypothetical protein NQZ68_038665 [Dissostichus eleginoides]